MRLVNIHTLKLHEFFEGSIPPYAILSHRWTDEELTFKELSKGRADVETKGYRKLLGACQISAHYSVDYVWIDTCCIDKRSCAELSESINSMFLWYEKAEVCLAYLEDVHVGPNLDEEFRGSAWFTRSWTLQELLAPKFVEFFDHHWRRFSSKDDNLTTLVHITGVEQHVLSGLCPVHSCSVGERMSWAADRQATRSEDIAYSLMGIFDVNMPLLYGEGQKAFERLQEEILRRSSDTTILSWGHDNEEMRLLARCPADFRVLNGLDIYSPMVMCRLGITNVGLEVHARVVRVELNTYGIVIGQESNNDTLHVLLVRKTNWAESFYRVGVEKIPTSYTGWRKDRTLTLVWGNGEVASAIREDGMSPYVRHGFRITSPVQLPVVQGSLRIRPSFFGRPESTPAHISPCTSGFIWDFGDPLEPAYATMICSPEAMRDFSMYLTFDFDGHPCCLVFQDAPTDPWEWFRTIDRSPELQSDETAKNEPDVIPVPDSTTGTTSWLFRHHGTRYFTSARIPVAITGVDQSVWLWFCPSGYLDMSATWTFGLSRTEPRLLRNNYSSGPLPQESPRYRIVMDGEA